jgi:hypothetical protein
VGNDGEGPWPAQFAAVDGDPELADERAFARLFDPESGLPDAALVVAHAAGGATAYLVRAGEGARLVHAAGEAELVYGALPDLVRARVWGEWREIPAFVPRSLRRTADWVVMAACLRAWAAPEA